MKWLNPGLLRAARLAAAAAVLAIAAGCQGPDATKFSCNSSNQCPTGYHCDLGTATTSGTFRCASGAPQPRTLAVDASKFQLVTKPNADGSIRTTIAASIGAVTSTPDFVGVRVVASQNNADLAESQVSADGSVLEFQLPRPTAQVSIRIEDDSGQSVPVTGYSQQVQMTFVGKNVTGTANQSSAYDVTTTSDSVYAPANWVPGGPGPGGRATEFAMADTLLPDGGIVSASSYTSIASPDYDLAASIAPGQLQDPTSTSSGSTVGWMEMSQLATAGSPDGGPPARMNATLSAVNGIVLYGGTDVAGNAVDPAGTFWTFDPANGWTQITAPTAAIAIPTGGAKSGVAMGYGGSTGCAAYPCTAASLLFSMAGGVGPAGVAVNRVVAYGTRSSYQTSSSPAVVTAEGWFDVGTLPFINAGMASAPAQIPLSNSSTSGSSETFAGLIMVGGQGIASGGSGVNSNDQSGCLLYAGFPFGSTSGIANKSISCTDANWVTATGAIGFRTGATLIPIDAQTFLLFGGLKQNGSSANGLKNDLWKGTLACNVVAPAVTCTTQVTWTQVTPTGTPPPARANAGGAAWQGTLVFTPTFAFHRRFAIYGGVNAAGNPLNDFWEYDLDANAWRQVPFDGGNALAPAARTQFTMTGDVSHGYIFGGVASGAATDQFWMTTREAPARILVRAPFSLPAIDQATNMKLTVEATGFVNGQAFLWDGTRWRFIGSGNFDGGGYHLLASPMAPATGFLQSGLFNLLLIGNNPGTPSFPGSAVPVDSVKLTVDFK